MNEILILINHLINKRVRLEQRDNLAVRRRIAESLSSQGLVTGGGDKGRDCADRAAGAAAECIRRPGDARGTTGAGRHVGASMARRLTARPSRLRTHHHQRCRSEEHTSELQSLMRITYAVI